MTLNITSLAISALCGPSSTDDATKKLEKVGAVALITLNTTNLPTDIDVNAYRSAIKAANAEKFATQTTFVQTSRDIWINVPGSDAGSAALNQVIYRSNATLLYVCVNTYNVKSALKTVKIAFNGTLNTPVKFAVSLSKQLTDDQLNNLTCTISRVVLNNDTSSFSKLKNNKGASCNLPKAARVLQAAVALGDYSFEVAADQTNDNFATQVKGKLNDAKTEVANLAKLYNATVLSDLSVLDTPPAGANLSAPVFGVNAVATNQNLTVTVNTTADARLYWVLTAKDALSSADDSVIRVNNSKAIQMGNFEVLVGKNVTSVLDKLNASTPYDLWVSGANKYDPLVKTAAKKYTVTTTAGSSFSSLLTLSSFILLVLALFI